MERYAVDALDRSYGSYLCPRRRRFMVGIRYGSSCGTVSVAIYVNVPAVALTPPFSELPMGRGSGERHPPSWDSLFERMELLQ